MTQNTCFSQREAIDIITSYSMFSFAIILLKYRELCSRYRCLFCIVPWFGPAFLGHTCVCACVCVCVCASVRACVCVCVCVCVIQNSLPLGSLVCDVFLYFVTFPCGILGQVWYLIVSIPDLCLLTFNHTRTAYMRMG